MFQHLNIIATTQQLQHNTPTMLLSQYQTYQLFINQLISIFASFESLLCKVSNRIIFIIWFPIILFFIFDIVSCLSVKLLLNYNLLDNGGATTATHHASNAAGVTTHRDFHRIITNPTKQIREV